MDHDLSSEPLDVIAFLLVCLFCFLIGVGIYGWVERLNKPALGMVNSITEGIRNRAILGAVHKIANPYCRKVEKE